MKAAIILCLVCLARMSHAQVDGLGETSEALKQRFKSLDTTEEGRALAKAGQFDTSKALAFVFRPELADKKLPANLQLHWRAEEPKHKAWVKNRTEELAMIRRAKVADTLPLGVGIAFGSDVTVTTLGGNGWEAWTFVSKGKTLAWQFKTKKDKDICLKRLSDGLEKDWQGLWLPSFDAINAPESGDVGEIRKAVVLTKDDVVTLQLGEDESSPIVLVFGVDTKQFQERADWRMQDIKPIPLRCVWVERTRNRTLRILAPVTDGEIDKWRNEFRSKHSVPAKSTKGRAD